MGKYCISFFSSIDSYPHMSLYSEAESSFSSRVFKKLVEARKQVNCVLNVFRLSMAYWLQRQARTSHEIDIHTLESVLADNFLMRFLTLVEYLGNKNFIRKNALFHSNISKIHFRHLRWSTTKAAAYKAKKSYFKNSKLTILEHILYNVWENSLIMKCLDYVIRIRVKNIA